VHYVPTGVTGIVENELSVYQVARPEEIVGAIDIAKSSGAAALNVLAAPLMFNNRQTIMERVAALGAGDVSVPGNCGVRRLYRLPRST
jgi:hypothetical protein